MLYFMVHNKALRYSIHYMVDLVVYDKMLPYAVYSRFYGIRQTVYKVYSGFTASGIKALRFILAYFMLIIRLYRIYTTW